MMQYLKSPWAIGLFAWFLCAQILSAIIGGVVCGDGWESASIGNSGACSHHGGVNNIPGNIGMIVSIMFGVWVGYSVHARRRPARSENTSETSLASVAFKRKIEGCPLCGGQMKSVTVHSNDSSKLIWRCLKHPECKGEELIRGLPQPGRH